MRHPAWLSPWWEGIEEILLFLLEIQTGRVDTVALASRLRAIVEKVTQMAPAICTLGFDTLHPEAPISDEFDLALVNGVKKARPS